MKRCLTILMAFLLGGGLIVSGTAQAQPALVINDISVTEPTGGTALATFTVSYTDGQAHGPTIIIVSTTSAQPAGASVATGGSGCSGNVDYVNVTGLAFTFSGASQTFTVTVCGDGHDEADQQFLVNLTSRGVVVQDAQGVATIIDDDPTPVISVRDVSVTEGSSGATTNATFAITVTGATERALSVQYATGNRSAIGGSCGSGADYEPIAPVTFLPTSLSTIPAQTSMHLVLVKVCADDISEGDQQFEIRLSNATHATIGNASALVTIIDDEPLPTLSITPQVVVNEPNALVPQAQAVFNVTFAGPATEQPVVVSFATTAGTATAGSSCTVGTNGRPADFVGQTGTLNFSPGKNVQQIRVPICADAVGNEPNETFSVTLARATNARITQGVGTATIH